MAFMAALPYIAAVAGAGASIFGSKQGSEDSEDAREFNRIQAEKAQAFSHDEADISRMFSASQAREAMDFSQFQVENQRVWSEKMASSGYQRAVADLGKAGLNPMLAYSQGAAPTPNTSAPSGVMGQSAMGQSSQARADMPIRQNYAAAVTNSAAQIAQIQNVNADTTLKEAQAQRELNSAENVKQQTVKIQVELPKLQAEAAHLHSLMDTELTKQTLNKAQTALIEIEKGVRLEQISQIKAETELAKIRTLLAKLAEPQARNAANAQDSWWMQNVSPYLPDVLKSGVILDRAIR